MRCTRWEEESEAKELLECMDEHLLDGITSWDRVCLAEGNFLELAASLNDFVRRANRSRAYVDSNYRGKMEGEG